MGGGKRMRGFLVLESAEALRRLPRQRAARGRAIEMLHAYSAWCMTTCRRWTMTTCAAASPPPTRPSARPPPSWPAMPCRPRPSPCWRMRTPIPTPPCGWSWCAAGHRLRPARHVRRPDAGHAGRAWPKPRTEASIGRLQLLKTGKLIEFSAEAGAILGKAPARSATRSVRYGRDLGAAFQIADDVLDATASAEETGKAHRQGCRKPARPPWSACWGWNGPVARRSDWP
jgi:farnesyl diphosphate synthase